MKFIFKHFGKVIKEIQLEEGQEYFIGRQKDCDFILGEETGLSRKHIRIYTSPETGNWIVESISEWGGLYLAGEEVESVEVERAGILSLKNYTLEFVKEKEESEKEKVSTGDLTKIPDSQPSFDPHAGTKVLVSSDLVHSLYIYISGEFSDHINLNERPKWIVGRSEECDISIDYSILTRKHFQISNREGKFYITDLGSANKTFLNDQEISPHKEILLKANDQISISDLKLVFEVRNKKYEEMMNQLPAVSEEDSGEGENLPEMALPKVVLETAPVEESAPSSKAKLLNPKRIVLLILVVCAGVAFYFKQEIDKKEAKRKALEKQQKEKEYRTKLEVFYKEAVDRLEEKKYLLCINQLEELHRESAEGYFKDSQQLLSRCQNALLNQRKKDEFVAQEKAKKETEAKIKKIVDKCKKMYAEKKIQTIMELNECARDLANLDPDNSDVSAMRREIEERENLKQMEEQKKSAYKKTLQSKRYLYNKAKKLKDQGKVLKAVSAYNVFLKSVKGFSGLKSLAKQAVAERDEIQKNYDDELNDLYQSCEKLIQQKKMKEAYSDCKKILAFKSDDKKALQYIQQALQTLQKELKPLYEQSMSEESFSRIEPAIEIWKEILKRDISDGYYYKKAQHQINKYK